MRLLLYGRTSDLPLQAVALGATALGWGVAFLRNIGFGAPQDCDVVAVWGLRGTNGIIRDAYRARGTPVLVLDFPKIRSQSTALYLGRDSLHWIPDEVPFDRLQRLALPPAVPSTGTGVLVLGQKPDDAAHGLTEYQLEAWASEVAATLQSRGIGPLRWRSHPLWPSMRPAGFDAYVPANTPLVEAFAQTSCVVTYNSTAGVEAVLAGLPLYVATPEAFTAPAATVGLPDGAPPPLAPSARNAFLARLAYCQWTPEELATGAPLRFTLTGVLPPTAAPTAPTPRAGRRRGVAA